MKLRKLFLILFPVLALSSCAQMVKPSSEEVPPEEQEEPIPEHVHSFEGAWQVNPREHWKICDGEDCEEVGLKGNHDFKLVQTIAKSCDDTEHLIYRCSVCNYEKIVDGHDYAPHAYSKEVTKVATCAEAGEITFTCLECGDKYVTPYEDHAAHHFHVKSESAGVITYECDQCLNPEVEYKVIDYKEQSEAVVAVDDLKDVGAVELQEATVALDADTLAALDDDVTITAEAVNVEDITELSEEAKAKIGTNKIVDFSLKNGVDVVSNFDGLVTITVPYTLKDGEDPNAIAVWYLDNGEPIAMSGKYNNGSVSFDTNHFSCYTVVHLSPEEVCESFGHHMVDGKHQDSTCTRFGYEDKVCTRCGYSYRNTLQLTPHNYEYFGKKEPTHTEEGYVEYKCSVCGDSYRSVIDKLPASERGFYFNFLKSLGTSDIKMDGVQTQNNVQNKVQAYLGRDFEGLPFAAAKVPMNYNADYATGENISGVYKGYGISSSLYLSEGQNTFVNVLSNFGVMADLVPGAVSDKIEEVGEWVEENFFVKEQINEGYSLTLNQQAVSDLIDLILDDTLREVLDEVLGDEAYDKLLDYVSKAYNNTIEELIEELEGEGFFVDELFDAVTQIIKLAGVPADSIPSLEEFHEMLDEMKEARIIDLIGGGEGSPIPQTFDDMKAMIDSYLGQNLFDIIKMIAGSSMRDPEATIAEVKEVVGRFKTAITLVVKTTSRGEFISMDMELAPTYITKDVGEISETIHAVKGFDKYEIIPDLDELLDKSVIRSHAMDITDSNYAWFTKPYEDMLNTTFTYRRNYIQVWDGMRDALISDKNVIQTYDYHGEAVNGKLVILLETNDSNYYSRGNVYVNKEGLGTKVAKGDYALVADAYQLKRAFLVNYIDSDGVEITEQDIPWEKENQLNEVSYMYSFTNNTIYSTQNGSYDYLHAHSYKYELLTREQFIDLAGYIPSTEWMDKQYTPVYYKATCDSCGASYFSYQSRPDSRYNYEYSIGSTYALSNKMNDAALEHIEKVGGFSVFATKNGLDYRPFEMSSASYGNAALELSSKAGTYECTRNVTWKVKVNNQVIRNGSFQYHAMSEYYESTELAYEDDCYSVYFEYRKCRCCGKTFYDSYEYIPHHNFAVVESHAKTATQAGYTVKECTNCHQINVTFEYPCTHNNYYYDTERGDGKTYFVCNSCGFECEVTDMSRPLFTCEQLEAPEGEKDSLYIGYLLGGTYYYYEECYYFVSTNYSFFLTYTVKGSQNEEIEIDGEVLRVAGNVDSEWRYVEFRSGNSVSRYQYKSNYMRFSQSEVEAMLARIVEETDYTASDLTLMVACVPNNIPGPSVPVYYYSF